MQQINLYRPEFRNSAESPNFQHILLACAGVAILFTLFFSVQLFRIHHLDSKIAETETSSNKLLAALGNSSTKANTNTQTVNQNIAKLKARLLLLRELTSALFNQSGSSINRQGFSNQMDGLVRQHVEGVSLSNMNIFDSGRSLILRGTASPAEKAPHYLSALQTDVAFQNVNFGQLQIRRNEENGELYFSLHHDKAETEQ